MLRKGQISAVEKISNISDIKGKRILEIGGDLKHEVADYLIEKGALHVTSINISPQVFNQKINDKLTTVNLDATKLTEYFESATFDMAFGVAILEHIHNTQLLLDQVYSVLKPKGLALLHGGPIWTSSIGHHTWVNCDEKFYRFNDQTNPIPDWYHLILNFDEMIEYLTKQKGIRHKHAEQLASYIYKGSDLSRMGYLDYINAFRNSKFKTIMIYEDPGKPLPQKIAERLRNTQYKNQKQFEVIAMQFILEK